MEKVQELTFSPSGTHKSLYATEIETWDTEGMESGKWQQWSATTDGNLKSHSGNPSVPGI